MEVCYDDDSAIQGVRSKITNLLSTNINDNDTFRIIKKRVILSIQLVGHAIIIQ